MRQIFAPLKEMAVKGVLYLRDKNIDENVKTEE